MGAKKTIIETFVFVYEGRLKMQQILKDNNIINLTGKILSECTFSHEVYGEGFYSFFLETSRLSNSSDILPITISERLMNEDMLKIGAFVHISGQIRSYNNFTDKKNRLILTVFTKDINSAESTCAKNPNIVLLNGFICKAPVYRTTPFGREIADILLAVNRAYNKSDYIPCICWGRNARFAEKLKIGNNIKLAGRMQSRIYQKKLENNDIIEKTAYEVSVSKMEIM